MHKECARMRQNMTKCNRKSLEYAFFAKSFFLKKNCLFRKREYSFAKNCFFCKKTFFCKRIFFLQKTSRKNCEKTAKEIEKMTFFTRKKITRNRARSAQNLFWFFFHGKKSEKMPKSETSTPKNLKFSGRRPNSFYFFAAAGGGVPLAPARI